MGLVWITDAKREWEVVRFVRFFVVHGSAIGARCLWSTLLAFFCLIYTILK